MRSHEFYLNVGRLVLAPGIEPDQALWNLRTSITNSVLELGGFVYQEGTGVFAQQVVQFTLAHSIVRNFSYSGVTVGWTWG